MIKAIFQFITKPTAKQASFMFWLNIVFFAIDLVWFYLDRSGQSIRCMVYAAIGATCYYYVGRQLADKSK